MHPIKPRPSDLGIRMYTTRYVLWNSCGHHMKCRGSATFQLLQAFRKGGWLCAPGVVQHGVQVCILGVQLVQISSFKMLTMGTFRLLHRSLVQLAHHLASMKCLPTAQPLSDSTAKHSTLFQEPWRVPCSTSTALEVRA